jgi:tRNA pseudouridine38-40 synthase
LRATKAKLIIAYDGTDFEGWQVQRTGTGVQQLVEQALARLFPSKPRLHSSSRTDTGVHALGMVAHFEVPKEEFRIPILKLPLALNAHLPETIRIMGAQRCHSDFHARFYAAGKQYRYFVWNHSSQNPLLRHQAWHVPRPVDVGAMRAAARALLGRRDFACFAATREYTMKSTVRTLQRCDVQKRGPLLTFIIEADGFLYKMCRGIVGTIIQIGLGKFPPAQVESMLRSKDRRIAGMSAPAHGLVLWKVFYPAGRKTPKPVAQAPDLQES